MKSIIKRIWTSSPSSIYLSIKKKLLYNHDWNYTVEAVLNDKKHLNPILLIDRWERLCRVVDNNIKKNNLLKEFNGKNIFELGCGPLLGFGPIFIFMGAQNFFYHEPYINLITLKSSIIKENYFRKMHNELVSNYGELMKFDKFYDHVCNQTKQIDFNQSELIDFSISNSVLEHIPVGELNRLIKNTFSVCEANCSYLHIIDFGYHSSTHPGFGKLYDFSKQFFHRGLNLARVSDVEKIFFDSGVKNLVRYVYRSEKVDIKKVNKFWTDKFSKEELEAMVVILASTKP